MAQLFRDRLREARGRTDVVRLWARTLIDTALTAPAEHIDTIRGSLMGRSREVRPLPWWQVLLVVAPGLLTLPTLMTGDGTGWVAGGIVVVLVVMAGEWWRTGSFPAWGLLMLGLMTLIGIGLLGAGAGSLVPGGTLLSAILLGLALATAFVAAGAVAARHLRGVSLPGSVPALLAALGVSAGGAGVLAGFEGGGPFSAAMLPAALLSGVYYLGLALALLVPVALGLPLARRYGLAAALFVVGCIYPLLNGIYDPGYALGLWTDSAALTALVKLSAPAMLLVAGPLWMLRARSQRWQARGLLIPLAAALVVEVVIPGLVLPYADWALWLRSALQMLNLLFMVLLALVLYARVADGPHQAVAAPVEPAPAAL